MPALLILTGTFAVFSIGGLIADYIFPHIGTLNHFIDQLAKETERSAQRE